MNSLNLSNKKFSMVYNNTFFNNALVELIDKITNIGPNSRNWVSLMKRYSGLEHWVDRTNSFTTPWNSTVTNLSLTLDQTFKKTYAEVCDEQALNIKKLLDSNENLKIVIFWSGGVDSTVILVSLLKNLPSQYHNRLQVALHSLSITENPIFYEKFLKNKITLIDSTNARSIIRQNYNDCIFIDGELNDQIFGSDMLCQFMYVESVETVKKPYKENLDLLFKFLANKSKSHDFVNWMHERVQHTINKSGVQIESIHDYFWWLNFNFKYANVFHRYKCNLLPTKFNTELRCDEVIDNNSFVHWYYTNDYQQWSMHNNNNGQKLGNTYASYKFAAKEYIYEFDKNDWYRNFKPKMVSLGNMTRTKDFTIFGLTSDNIVIDYQMHTSEIDKFAIESFENFEKNCNI